MKRWKRYLANFLVAVCCVGGLPLRGSAEEQDNSLVIQSAAELQAFAAEVNAGNSFEGENIFLGRDIDMSGQEFTAIGTLNSPFKGVFDGDGHTVSNLELINIDSDHQGLFGVVNDGTVKNVDLENVNISGRSWIGGIAGYTNGVIENCIVSGSVRGSFAVGGIAGDLYGRVAECINRANISGSTQIVGGIAGYMGTNAGIKTQIVKSINEGPVTGVLYTGGVAGNMTAGEITACSNQALVTATGYDGFTGGIAGSLGGGTISRCFNAGQIDGSSNYTISGGIVGYLSSGTVENNYNLADIAGNLAAGGIVGGIDGNSPVVYCYSTGNVTSELRVGGAVGWNRAGAVTDCYYNADVYNGNAFGDNTAGGTAYGATTAELKKQETYSGFDFETIWQISAEENSGYPYFREMADAGKEQITADYDWLTFDKIKGKNSSSENITECLDLPVVGAYGSRIFWSTDDSSVLLNSGVPIPDSTGNKTVTLTARIVSEDAATEKEFELTIAKETFSDKPLHILQIGDSNTEFGRITQGMNEVLKEKYGDYGDGFLTLAKDYYGLGDISPENYTISYTGQWTQHDLGISDVYNSPFGIYVDSTQIGSAITIEFVGSAVDFYYLSMPASGSFHVHIDGVDKGVVSQQNAENTLMVKKAVFDGLEYGKHTIVLTNEDGGHVNFYGADYRVADAETRKNISTWGNGGIQAYEYANSLNPDIFKEALAELNPNVVAILIGTNDNGAGRSAEVFRQSLTTMVDRVQESLPDAEIWIVSTFETGVNPSAGLQSYWDTVFPEVAEEQGAHYWSMGEWFGPYSTDLMQDPWHCNPDAGYHIAEKMYEVILAGEDVIGRNIVSVENDEIVKAKTGTAFEDLNLPKRVSVTLDDFQNTVTTAEVEWDSSNYVMESEGVYTLTGILADNEDLRIYNPDNITASIQVDVKDIYVNEKEPGLLLYYNFSQPDGTTVKDITGNYDGTIVGNVTSTEGINGGNALYFPNDVNAYVDIPVEVFENLRDVTISAWVKMDQINTWTTLLGVGSDQQNYFQVVASGIPSTGACGISTAIKDTKGKEYRTNAAADDTPEIGEWCMVTYTQEGSVGKLYLNGKPVATSNIMRKTFADITGGKEATAHLGAPQVWPDPATFGAIDEFMIYNYALSEEEVNNVMDEQLNGEKHTPVFIAAKEATCKEEGNIAYWKCSECGKCFSDEACTKEITSEDIVIERKAHNYRDGICTVCGAEDPDYDFGEKPGGEEPGTEEPGGEGPGTEEPGGEGPGTEEPGGEEPGTEEPGGEEPGTEEPGGEEPGTEEPSGEEPGTEGPGGEEPGTVEPGGEKPGMEEPDGEKSDTEESGREKPGMEESDMNNAEYKSDAPETGDSSDFILIFAGIFAGAVALIVLAGRINYKDF